MQEYKGYQLITFQLSTILVSLQYKLDFQILKEVIEEHFKEHPNQSLYLLICSSCKYGDKSIDGYREIYSLQELENIIASTDNINVDITSDELPSAIKQLGNLMYWIYNCEEEYMAQMEYEMQAEYEKQMQEEYELEQWREETFTSDGEIIE